MRPNGTVDDRPPRSAPALGALPRSRSASASAYIAAIAAIATALGACVLASPALAQDRAATTPNADARVTVLAAATRQPTGVGVPVWITWRAGAGAGGLYLETPSTAAIIAVDGTRTCPTTAVSAGSTLQLPLTPDAGAAVICLFGERPGAVHVLVRTTTADGDFLVAQSPSIVFEPVDDASFWNRPGVSTLLSALIGFVFGLLSTALTTAAAEWRESRATRRETEKWVIDTVLPEIREHAQVALDFERASPANRLTLAVNHLAMANVTAARSGKRVWQLSTYLPSVRGVDLRFLLQDYALALERHNREVDALSSTPAASRNLSGIVQSFEVLARIHRQLGLRP